MTEKERLAKFASKEVAAKSKEQLAAAAEAELSAQGRIHDLESKLSSAKASAAGASKELDAYKSRYAEAVSAQKVLKEQLVHANTELERANANLAEVTEKEAKGRSIAWETTNKLKEKLAVSVENEAALRGRVAELESAFASKHASHSTATKEADVLRARVADLESSCRTLREQLSSSQSEFERTQASLADMTDKEIKGRQNAKEVIEKLREKLSLASETELSMKARTSELEDTLKAKSMSLAASHKDVDSLKARLADSEAAHKTMSDQFLQCSVELEKSQSSARICSKKCEKKG
jgi:chromosome segregation ATPase